MPVGLRLSPREHKSIRQVIKGQKHFKKQKSQNTVTRIPLGFVYALSIADLVFLTMFGCLFLENPGI